MWVIPRVRLEVVVFIEPVSLSLLVRRHTEHCLLSLALVLGSFNSSQERMVHVVDNRPDLGHLRLWVVLEDTTDQTAIPLTRLHCEAGAVETYHATAGVDETLECLELGRIEEFARALQKDNDTKLREPGGCEYRRVLGCCRNKRLGSGQGSCRKVFKSLYGSRDRVVAIGYGAREDQHPDEFG